MRTLLDTHVWIWWLLDDKRVKRAHALLIEDPEAELFLSPISVWEAHFLIERKRIKATLSPAQWLQDAMKALPVREAPLTFAIVERSRTLQLPHADPADRFIAATAAEMKIPLMTADSHLLRCPDIQCVR